MKKVLSTVAAVAVAAGLLTGCGSSQASDPDAKQDLTFWVYSDFTQGEAGELMNKFVDEFKQEHDNVGSVTLVPKNDADLLSGLMSGVGLPDAFSASARDGKKYRDAVGLLDLKPTFDEEYSEGFYPKALDAVSEDDGIWAVPFISYTPVIYRNLTVLKNAGVDPAEGIPTQQVFLEQLAKVQASGVSATHSWTKDDYFAPGAIMAADADNITVGVEDGKTTIDPEELERTFESVEAINKYGNQSMIYKADSTMEAFKSDELGYMIGGPWSEPAIKESGAEYDFVLTPPFEEGGRTGGLQGWDFFYGVQSEDDTRNELVADWLKKLGSYDAQKAWTLATGRPTLRQDVMDDPAVVDSSAMAEVSSEGLKGGMPQMDFMHSSVFWPTAMTDAVAELGAGALTPKQTAEQFVEGINGLYAESGE
ncbi:ABC transporter substrate-binding protein [Arthrobacter sp. Soc17.1.1.1]|uniref:sugar ABC transporter substrate-binding protein n=1 Tax=Arthrobacter sp. Soc17.1.1.1 TaxID=3121277 RepID=UPI002FE4F11B